MLPLPRAEMSTAPALNRFAPVPIVTCAWSVVAVIVPKAEAPEIAPPVVNAILS